MLHLYLPGYNPTNAAFATKLGRKFQKLEMNCYPRYWPHWQEISADTIFDPLNEVTQIVPVVKEFKRGGIGIIAKSVGTRVAVEIAATAIEKSIQYVILMGIPLSLYSEDELVKLHSLLGQTGFEIHIFQNNGDPVANAEEVTDLIKEYPHVKLHKYQESHHSYEYLSDIIEIAGKHN